MSGGERKKLTLYSYDSEERRKLVCRRRSLRSLWTKRVGVHRSFGLLRTLSVYNGFSLTGSGNLVYLSFWTFL